VQRTPELSLELLGLLVVSRRGLGLLPVPPGPDESGVIYFIACTLVPRNAPDVESWREYLLSVRVRYFLAVACFVVVAALISTLLGEVSAWSPLRAVQAAIFLVAIVGIRSDDERILAALAVLIIAVVVVGLFLLRRPAPLVGI
jgi:predicted branched-subunit amino acid permease